MTPFVRFVRRLVPLVAAGAAMACDMQPDPPEGPSDVGPRVVDVRIEYRQPQGCENAEPEHCVDLVWFFGSWMHPGEEIPLEPVAGSFVWTGKAAAVPVNWPPTDEPHFVRVFDPHLRATASGGVTAARLILGGQPVTQYDQPGTPQESGLVYVDDNGVGRSPM
jgi:hypothetical protein